MSTDPTTEEIDVRDDLEEMVTERWPCLTDEGSGPECPASSPCPQCKARKAAMALINHRFADVSTDARVEALQAFKDFVHRRLDTAGVPTHPEGPHSAQGCRIGDRLDLALAVIPAARKILRTLNYHIDNSPSNAMPVYTGIADLRDVLKAVSPAPVLQKAQPEVPK